MSAPFPALHAALFDALGEPATVQRGTEPAVPVRAIVRVGVTNIGDMGRVVSGRITVCLPRTAWLPRRGDQVTVRGIARPVEAVLADDGYVVEAVLHG